MGDVIPFRPPLHLARDLLDGLADFVEQIVPDDQESMLIRDVAAERISEAHDILKKYIEDGG